MKIRLINRAASSSQGLEGFTFAEHRPSHARILG
jgi:hypothetical protein